MTTPLLERTTSALEDGNWPAPLAALRSAVLPGPEPLVHLAWMQQEIAESMRLQAVGEVLRAQELLCVAAAMLPRQMRHTGDTGRPCAVLLPDLPVGHAELWVWRTARVVVREQAGLAEHEARLHPDRVTVRDAFVVAAEERERWIDCFAIRAPRAHGIPVAESDSRLARRATELCRLGGPRTPTLDTKALRRVGGRGGVVDLAMTGLAGRELVPAAGPGHLPASVPVRRGREEARRRACQHVADLRRG